MTHFYFHRAPASVLILAAAVLTVGCKGSTEKMAPVSGKVTVAGQPLSSGSVTLIPTSGESKAGLMAGQIDSSGTYTIHTGGKDGAPLGKYKVKVDPSMVPSGDGKPPVAGFSHKYQDSQQTPLTIEVVENATPGAYDLKLTK